MALILIGKLEWFLRYRTYFLFRQVIIFIINGVSMFIFKISITMRIDNASKVFIDYYSL